MARSRKKTPMAALCNGHMKAWKKMVSRKFRKKAKQLLYSEGEDAILPEDLNEVSDIWCSPADGWVWLGDLEEDDWMPGFYEKMMRK